MRKFQVSVCLFVFFEKTREYYHSLSILRTGVHLRVLFTLMKGQSVNLWAWRKWLTLKHHELSSLSSFSSHGFRCCHIGESQDCPPQDCPPEDNLEGGQSWVHQSSGLPTPIITFFQPAMLMLEWWMIVKKAFWWQCLPLLGEPTFPSRHPSLCMMHSPKLYNAMHITALFIAIYMLQWTLLIQTSITAMISDQCYPMLYTHHTVQCTDTDSCWQNANSIAATTHYNSVKKICCIEPTSSVVCCIGVRWWCTRSGQIC